MNEDSSGNIASLQEEIRRLKQLLQGSKGSLCPFLFICVFIVISWVYLRRITFFSASTSIAEISTQLGTVSVVQSATKSEENNQEEWKEIMLTSINLKEKAEQEKQVGMPT